MARISHTRIEPNIFPFGAWIGWTFFVWFMPSFAIFVFFKNGIDTPAVAAKLLEFANLLPAYRTHMERPELANSSELRGFFLLAYIKTALSIPIGTIAWLAILVSARSRGLHLIVPEKWWPVRPKRYLIAASVVLFAFAAWALLFGPMPPARSVSIARYASISIVMENKKAFLLLLDLMTLPPMFGIAYCLSFFLLPKTVMVRKK